MGLYDYLVDILLKILFNCLIQKWIVVMLAFLGLKLILKFSDCSCVVLDSQYLYKIKWILDERLTGY